MEELLNEVINQTIPRKAFIFIIANIIIAFMTVIITSILVIRGVTFDNIIHVDYVITGLFAIMGDIVLIITGIASIQDYRKAMRKRINEIKENK